MKLLICTQVVDTKDPVLGFFVRWIEELAKRTEQVTVICLRSGEHALPDNVSVISLGAGRLQRSLQLLKIAYVHKQQYDAVFVHMNQEYILVVGWLWKLLGKKVYMWRNHYSGSLLTDIAAGFCEKVFCTSKHSYTAKYTKTELMPVGVDTERFNQDARVVRIPRSILFLARMSPSKRPEMLIEALVLLAKRGVDFTATIVGSPLPKDDVYYKELQLSVRDAGISDRVTFKPSVPNNETPDLYRAHKIFVNTSPSGMFDKTIFEAAACGCSVLASSQDWKSLVGEVRYFNDATTLETRLAHVLDTSGEADVRTQEVVAAKQSLNVLINQLSSL